MDTLPPHTSHRTAHVVQEGGIAAWLGQQQPNSIQAPVLAGTHERCGPICILCVHICPTGQQGCHHVLTAVADGQHEGCLPCLGSKEADRTGKGAGEREVRDGLALKVDLEPERMGPRTWVALALTLPVWKSLWTTAMSSSLPTEVSAASMRAE